MNVVIPFFNSQEKFEVQALLSTKVIFVAEGGILKDVYTNTDLRSFRFSCPIRFIVNSYEVKDRNSYTRKLVPVGAWYCCRGEHFDFDFLVQENGKVIEKVKTLGTLKDDVTNTIVSLISSDNEAISRKAKSLYTEILRSKGFSPNPNGGYVRQPDRP